MVHKPSVGLSVLTPFFIGSECGGTRFYGKESEILIVGVQLFTIDYFWYYNCRSIINHDFSLLKLKS